MVDAVHAALLELSERLLAAARDGDWETVASLEDERVTQIALLPTTESEVMPLLKVLLAHTEEVRRLAQSQRDRLGADLQDHQHRHRALSAYLHAGAE
nr:flagellar protein FliT [Dyella sp. ASV24]